MMKALKFLLGFIALIAYGIFLDRSGIGMERCWSKMKEWSQKGGNFMETIFGFLRAALPWIAVGLLLAVLAVRGARKKKKDKKTSDYGAEGMCLGMCFGTAIGTAFGNNIAIGLPLGMLLGLAIGTGIKKKEQDDDKKR